MNLLASWTMDMWSPIINLFSFIPNYGWMIIVFTIALKIVLSPLDIWQRKVSRDSTLKQQRMQPQLQKLQKQYGNDRQTLNKKQMALYKKEGYNVVGSCVSMLVNLVLTLFIFFTLFSGLSEMSQEKTYQQYVELNKVYQTTFVETLNDSEITKYDDIYAKIITKIDTDEIKAQAKTKLAEDGINEPTEYQIRAKGYEIVIYEDYATEVDAAQKAVAEKYEEIKDSWLWVDSIWRPETYVSGVGNYNDFYGIANLKARFANDEAGLTQISYEYNTVTKNIQAKYSSWNGYFILAILCGFVTYLSFMLTQNANNTQKQKTAISKYANGNMVDGINKNKQQQQPDMQKSMGIMKFLMPAIMVIFVLCYSTAFALYILANSVMSVIIALCCRKLFEHMDKNKKHNDAAPVVEYSRNNQK